MDYKLAKQLKDAGFPQDICAGQSFFIDSKCNGRVWTDKEPCKLIDNVKIPTLEELIDECGEQFGYLTKVITKEGVFWEAFDIDGNSGGKEKIKKEAVAKLWLKLQKNVRIRK